MESVFWCASKSKEEAYEKSIEISRNNDYTTGNLLDYEHFSTQINWIKTPDLKQQINFIGKFEDNRAAMFFIILKSKENNF